MLSCDCAVRRRGDAERRRSARGRARWRGSSVTYRQLLLALAQACHLVLQRNGARRGGRALVHGAGARHQGPAARQAAREKRWRVAGGQVGGRAGEGGNAVAALSKARGRLLRVLVRLLLFLLLVLLLWLLLLLLLRRRAGRFSSRAKHDGGGQFSDALVRLLRVRAALILAAARLRRPGARISPALRAATRRRVGLCQQLSQLGRRRLRLLPPPPLRLQLPRGRRCALAARAAGGARFRGALALCAHTL